MTCQPPSVQHTCTQGLGFHIPERFICRCQMQWALLRPNFCARPADMAARRVQKFGLGDELWECRSSALPETTAGSLWNIIRVETLISSLAWCPGDEAYSSCILLEKFGSIVIQANNAMESTLLVVTIVVSQSQRTSVSAKLSATLCSSPQYMRTSNQETVEKCGGLLFLLIHEGIVTKGHGKLCTTMLR